jgi:hypothetical protein
VQRGHGSRLVVNVRNNGALPVAARLEMERHEAFMLLEGPQVGGTPNCGSWQVRRLPRKIV